MSISVNLGDRSYEIIISDTIDFSSLSLFLEGKRSFIISDTNVAPLYLEQLKKALPGVIGEHAIPAGESSKSLEQAHEVYTSLIHAQADRKTVVIALGGGVVGDLAGFIASTYMRGVPFIQIPTTLLAMVDSSVGGKVAVNHPLGKNLIGHFYQPEGVWIFPKVLTTLTEREVSAGLAEVIKYGIIWDASFFQWLEENIDHLHHQEPAALHKAISVSVAIKADIVSRDEKEEGVRAILNLGHTFGHAEEALSGYGKILHGEAVGAGMVVASALSQERGHMPQEEYLRVHTLVQKAKLPTKLTSSNNREEFWHLMQGDKKSLAGTVKFVIPTSIGSCRLPESIDSSVVDRVLDSL